MIQRFNSRVRTLQLKFKNGIEEENLFNRKLNKKEYFQSNILKTILMAIINPIS